MSIHRRLTVRGWVCVVLPPDPGGPKGGMLLPSLPLAQALSDEDVVKRYSVLGPVFLTECGQLAR